jgi:hypothetical protein
MSLNVEEGKAQNANEMFRALKHSFIVYHVLESGIELFVKSKCDLKGKKF